MHDPGMPSAVERALDLAARRHDQFADRSAAAIAGADPTQTTAPEAAILDLGRLPSCLLCDDWGRLDDIPCPRCA